MKTPEVMLHPEDFWRTLEREDSALKTGEGIKLSAEAGAWDDLRRELEREKRAMFQREISWHLERARLRHETRRRRLAVTRRRRRMLRIGILVAWVAAIVAAALLLPLSR